MKRWAELGVLAVEMEAAALYINAARTQKKALCICTVSDNAETGERMSAQERQTNLDNMIKIALDMDI